MRMTHLVGKKVFRAGPMLVATVMLSCSAGKGSDIEQRTGPIGVPGAGEQTRTTRERIALEKGEAAPYAVLLPSLVAITEFEDALGGEVARVCAGVHVGEGRILTSGACISDCAKVSVRFIDADAVRVPQGTPALACEPESLVAKSEEGADWSFFKLKDAATVTAPALALNFGSGLPSAKSQVEILGFDETAREMIFLSRNCELRKGETDVSFHSHNCDVSKAAQGALVLSVPDRQPIALFSKVLDGWKQVTSFNRVDAGAVPTPTPSPSPNPEATPSPTPSPSPTP